MSATVKVMLNSSRADETSSVPVVISVLDADLETVAGPSSFFVSEDATFPVDPGAYVVHVDPPSGQRLQRTVTVADGQSATASFFLHDLSGHESLEKPALFRGVDRRPEWSGLDSEE